MLASITPLGERGRHRRYAVTLTALVIGAAGAGAGLGAALGALGALLVGGLAPSTRLVLLAGALAVALGVELWLPDVPGPRRQVDERWLDSLRGWVYGAGYGVQLGVGISTVVTSAATYVALLAALLSARAGSGALVLGLYGLLRGATPLLAGGVRTPDQLIALHTHLERARGLSEQAGRLALAVLVLLAIAGS